MKLHIGGVSLFLALSGLPLGIANALDTGVQNLRICLNLFIISCKSVG